MKNILLCTLFLISTKTLANSYALVFIESSEEKVIYRPKADVAGKILSYQDESNQKQSSNCAALKSLKRNDTGLDMTAKYSMSSVMGGVIGLALGGPFFAAALATTTVTYLMSEPNVIDQYCNKVEKLQ